MYKRYSESRQGSGEMEHFELNTGQMIPAVGLGTWQVSSIVCNETLPTSKSNI